MNDHGVIRDGERARLVGWFENFDGSGIFARGHRLVVIDAAIDGAHEHGSCADVAVGELKMTLRVGLGVRDRLHAALQLDQNYFNASRGFVGRAVMDRAGKRAGIGRAEGEA